jgi:nucleoside-diphosphate-sugar epimerase
MLPEEGITGETRAAPSRGPVNRQFRLSAAVMCHPRRAMAASNLAVEFPDGVAQVVTDPNPSGPPTTFRTAMRAWSAIPEWASHHMVIQDDIALAAGFYEYVEQAINSFPRAALAMYTNWNCRNGAVVRIGALAGAAWAPAVCEYTPDLALVLPRKTARGYVEYAQRGNGAWPDDVAMYRYLRSIGLPTLLAVPNLVEHRPWSSVANHDFFGPRHAACFLGERPADLDDATRTLGVLDAVPFFKYGIAQCAVRIPGEGKDHWEEIETDRYLQRAGISVDRCRRRFAADVATIFDSDGNLPPAVTRTDLWGLWLTAFTLGVVGFGHSQRLSHQHRSPPVLNKGLVAERALSTLGPGGLCHRLGTAALQEIIDDLHRLSRHGLQAAHGTPIAASSQTSTELAAARRAAVHGDTRAQRLVVTGGRGPYAEFLIRALADHGWEVVSHGPDLAGRGHPAVRCVAGGVTGAAGGDSLRHIAADADALVYLDEPTAGPRVGADVATRTAEAEVGRLIYLSTAGVYDRCRAVRVDEAMAIAPPRNPRAAMKYATERAIALAAEETALQVTALRLTVVYGPGAQGGNPLATLIHDALTGRPLRAEEPERVQLVHMRDVAAAIHATAAGTTAEPILNIGDDQAFTIGELAELVRRMVRPGPAATVSTGEPQGPVVATDRARTNLGWMPMVSIEDGVRLYYQWLAYGAPNWERH